MTSTHTEAGAVAEITRRGTLAEPTAVNPFIDSDAGTIVGLQTVYRDDENVDVSTHEQLRFAPYRQRGTTHLSTVDAFTHLTNRLGGGNTVVFADERSRRLTAVLNYADGWGDHRAEYAPTIAPEWKTWKARNGVMMGQREFAEHLQDLRHTIVEPAAADIVQIARTFTATRTANFEGGVRLASGDVQFSYVQETRAQAGPKGGTVEVPEEIRLSLPIFRDSSAPTPVTVEFRFEVSERGLTLGYRIVQLEDIEETAWMDIFEQAGAGLTDGIDLLAGSAPDPIDPIR